MSVAEQEARRREAHEELDRCLNMLFADSIRGFRFKQTINRGRVTYPVIDVTLKLDRPATKS